MSMLQVSRRADYAVRIMVELGSGELGHYQPTRKVSKRTGVSKAFLYKIAADLVKANLIRTQAGPTGGMALARSADQINMLQILEAIEGPLCLNTCLLRPEECPRDLTCPAHGFWGRLQTTLAQELTSATLDKLVEEAALLKRQPRSREDIPYLSRQTRDSHRQSQDKEPS